MGKKLKILLRDSYLGMIRNSEGTKMFRDFFGRVGKNKRNLAKEGRTSCALFVSSIIHHFKLIKEPHLTVSGTLKDMKISGWLKTKNPLPGDVILWDKKNGHYHLGFCLGRDKAISNDREKGLPLSHNLTFGGKRKIKAFFRKRI
ncbi:MAG: hypothetical protein V1841_02080 [Patescibacteria group bacterium]